MVVHCKTKLVEYYISPLTNHWSKKIRNFLFKCF